MAENTLVESRELHQQRIEECIRAVCRIPLVVREDMNVSKLRLIEESGYAALADEITEAVFEDYLRLHPDLVPVWEIFSSDQKAVPGHGFARRRAVADPEKGWYTYYTDHDPEKEWELDAHDRYAACAFFVKRRADDLAAASAHRRR